MWKFYKQIEDNFKAITGKTPATFNAWERNQTKFENLQKKFQNYKMEANHAHDQISQEFEIFLV